MRVPVPMCDQEDSVWLEYSKQFRYESIKILNTLENIDRNHNIETLVWKIQIVGELGALVVRPSM